MIPLLALTMTLAVAASAQAQYRYDHDQRSDDASATLQVTFGSAPHWTEVRGTRVQEIRQGERPDYDMFRLDNSYYVYNNSRWYTSNDWRGSFRYVDAGSVPTELYQVPREHWRQYPAEWQDRNQGWRDRNDASATLQVTFGSAPHWTSVNGTRVQEIRQGERPDYDMFRYDNSYYVYNNSRWYTSNDWRGSFRYVDAGSVPTELSQVPREHWRQYPAEWQDRNDQGWRDRNDQGWRDRSDRGSQGTSGALQITFGRQPRWTTVRGTRVWMIRQGQRPDYDMFRYGNNYYVYNNDQWYVSRQWRGQFRPIDVRMVPMQLAMVPRNHWRNYPQDWANENYDSRNDQRWHRR